MNTAKLNPYAGEPERSLWSRGMRDGENGEVRDKTQQSAEYEAGYDVGIAIFRMNMLWSRYAILQRLAA